MKFVKIPPVGKNTVVNNKVTFNGVLRTLSDAWNNLSSRFDTHKACLDIHPDAVVNIEVGWPVFFNIIDDFAKGQKGVSKLKILDFGCGAGSFCLKLHEKGYDVKGIDISEEMLKLASRALGNKVPLKKGSHIHPSFHSEWKNSFDVVTAIHSLEWNKDIDVVLSNLANTLKKGGMLIFAVFPKEHIKDSLRIKDLFEDFDSEKDPTEGYANFDGVRVPVYAHDAKYYDRLMKKLGFKKVIEKYPSYPKGFFERHAWTASKCPEMMILGYSKK